MESRYINSLGQVFVPVPAGQFQMGETWSLLPDAVSGITMRSFGHFDERPVHDVTISRSFLMAATPVTNRQYEAFDPAHYSLRKKLGLSGEDDEAVLFVSWHEARAFCAWLSEKEEKPYRLPTEAEWEYACRAGTNTPYWTGEQLPEDFLLNARRSRFPDPARTVPEDYVALHVGRTAPNPWGLHDMHGLVEEWCEDWYGPYTAGSQVDPVGYQTGTFRVTRGGSHSTEPYYLRAAARMGTLPDDRHWLIGFRPVIAPYPDSTPLPVPSPARHQQNVRQDKPVPGGNMETPVFEPPRCYVRIEPEQYGPIYPHHNHDPALVCCPNGDLLAVWYSCMTEAESDRELYLAGARLRWGESDWDPASPFWGAPGRNNHAPALGVDRQGRVYHFCGLSAAASWSNLAIILRTSDDNGATWSEPRLIVPEHAPGHMPSGSLLETRDGRLWLPIDTRGGTGLLVSDNRGATWRDTGGTIAGIHACVAERSDGALLALARGSAIDGHMPLSLSFDGGASWEYHPSPFPPVQGGQRPALLRLPDGALFLTSFSNNGALAAMDGQGREQAVSGLFGALSFDDGATWPVRRLLSDGGQGRIMATTTNRPPFVMDACHAEPVGYLAAAQTPDGRIHVISSRQHYAFTREWLINSPAR